MTEQLQASDLGFLPAPAELERNCHCFAALDAILEEKWSYRYHSFYTPWEPGRMAALRTGSGDHWHAVFEGRRVFIKGFSLDGSRSHPRDQCMAVSFATAVPVDFHPLLHEPAFYVDETGYCLWWDGGWHGVVLSRAERDLHLERLQCVAGGAAQYLAWAQDYFEKDLDLRDVEQLWTGSVSQDCVERLHPGRDVASLKKELRAMGFGWGP